MSCVERNTISDFPCHTTAFLSTQSGYPMQEQAFHVLNRLGSVNKRPFTLPSFNSARPFGM
jgi:hypothetical protein